LEQRPSSIPDQQLVTAALGGDRAAFAALVQRYGPAVKAVAYGILRDHHLAEDAAQDAFVSAHRQLARLRLRELFGRWLLAIARQRALACRRTLKVQLPLDAAHDVELPRLVDHDLLDEVMALPERERRLVLLRYFSGYSIAEIARITDRPLGTVTKQISRACQRLRRQFSEVLK
jgi:RNA polymerase sigma-70 factor (ECF subfamily)